MNIAGCLFYAGILCYWSDTLSSSAQKDWAASQANSRVNVNWGYNLTRGIMCNWLVGIAFFFSTEGRDLLGKIVGIWIAIWTFVGMGYQVCLLLPFPIVLSFLLPRLFLSIFPL
jgi:formate/nitrite transporter FocA (FNT family)